MNHDSVIRRLSICAGFLLATNAAHAVFFVDFSSSDFVTTPVFSDVENFDFEVRVAGSLTIGTYDDPTVNRVQYFVFGSLAPGTPSGFSGFNLERTIIGNEFYTQGSSLDFTISATANLSDGLQVSDLSGPDPVFVLNAREVDTGRYHPPLVQLNSNGTGSIRNSNNMGGVNPATGQVVDVDFGEEYITDLTFNPDQLTLSQAVGVSADFNFDGILDGADMDGLCSAVAAGANDPAFDLNADGVTDSVDCDQWLVAAGAHNLPSGNPYLRGDANLDGVVDVTDFSSWNDNKFTVGGTYTQGDFNCDGVVDTSDFNVWNAVKFTSSDERAMVPEPTGLLLLAWGLAGLLRCRDRRHQV